MNEFEALKRLRQETCPATYMPDFNKEECLEVIEKALLELKIKADKYDKINKVFNDSHTCEIKKELAKYEPLCEETKCDECALGIGDGICLKAMYEIKWEIQKEKQKLEKAWEIAKGKNVDIGFLKWCLAQYDSDMAILVYNGQQDILPENKLTHAEFDLLKEMLE